MRSLAKNTLLLLLLLIVAAYFWQRFPEMEKGTDFPDFYVAARMVQEGRGPELYNPAVQLHFQQRYAGRVGTLFIHPPFETLLYLPLSYASLERAYLLWSLVNLAFFVLVAKVLGRQVFTQWDWRLLPVLFFLFPPVLLNFVQGQDSVLLLLLLVLAFWAFQNEHSIMAGCLLACGLFKFHLIIPTVTVLAFGRMRKFLAGFAGVAILLFGISAAISGWGFPGTYIHFLGELKNLSLAGIDPNEMADLRGLASLVLRASSGLALPITVILSALVVASSSWVSRKASANLTDLIFAQAVLAAVLVAYHLSPHDLSVLVLPLALILRRAWTANLPKWLRILYVVIAAALLLPPLHLLLLAAHAYALMGVLILLLFVLTFFDFARTSAVTRHFLTTQ